MAEKKSLRQIIRKKIRKNKIEVKGNKFFKKAYAWYENNCKDFNIDFEIESNIENRVSSFTVKSFVIDSYFEHLLDEETYSFDKPLIEVDPYNTAPLSAVMIFNTKEDMTFSYTIEGQNGAAPYTRESHSFTKRHRIPIVGLYDGRVSKVNVTLTNVNGKNKLEKSFDIKTSTVDEVLKNVLTPDKDQKLNIKDDEFFLITGGFGGTTCGFDNCCNLRFALSKAPHPYGVNPINDGRFIYVEKEMRRPNYGNAHSVITYEMDYSGRAYKTYKLAKGTHHWISSESNTGNILFDTSSYDDAHLENMISEVDYNTGEILRNFSMNDFFDDTYVNMHDWAHINSFQYIPEEDTIVVSMRNIHTIAKLDMKTKKILWIMTNPEFYKGTEQEDLVLEPLDGFEWFYQQHGVRIIKHDLEKHVLQLVFFDNHTANRRPVDWFDGKEESNLLVVEIDEVKKTVKQLKRFPAQLSITRSNALITEDFKTAYAMCGNLADHVPGKRAKIYEYDMETGELLNLVNCKRDYFCVQIINIDVDKATEPLEWKKPQIFGEIKAPEKVDRVPKLIRKGDESDQINKIRFRIFDDILQIRCKDHRVKKVFIYNKQNKYLLDFTDTKQESKIFKKQSYFINVPLGDIKPGRYRVGIKFKKELYKTAFWINKKQ